MSEKLGEFTPVQSSSSEDLASISPAVAAERAKLEQSVAYWRDSIAMDTPGSGWEPKNPRGPEYQVSEPHRRDTFDRAELLVSKLGHHHAGNKLASHQRKYDVDAGFTYDDEKKAIEQYDRYKKAALHLGRLSSEGGMPRKYVVSNHGIYEYKRDRKKASEKVESVVGDSKEDFAKNGDTYHMMALAEDRQRSRVSEAEQLRKAA